LRLYHLTDYATAKSTADIDADMYCVKWLSTTVVKLHAVIGDYISSCRHNEILVHSIWVMDSLILWMWQVYYWVLSPLLVLTFVIISRNIASPTQTRCGHFLHVTRSVVCVRHTRNLRYADRALRCHWEKTHVGQINLALNGGSGYRTGRNNFGNMLACLFSQYRAKRLARKNVSGAMRPFSNYFVHLFNYHIRIQKRVFVIFYPCILPVIVVQSRFKFGSSSESAFTNINIINRLVDQVDCNWTLRQSSRILLSVLV